MIQQRIVVGEAFGRKKLLTVQTAIGFAKLHVALVGNISEFVVIHDFNLMAQ
jgi:hypothetical protein